MLAWFVRIWLDFCRVMQWHEKKNLKSKPVLNCTMWTGFKVEGHKLCVNTNLRYHLMIVLMETWSHDFTALWKSIFISVDWRSDWYSVIVPYLDVKCDNKWCVQFKRNLKWSTNSSLIYSVKMNEVEGHAKVCVCVCVCVGGSLCTNLKKFIFSSNWNVRSPNLVTRTVKWYRIYVVHS